MLIVDRMRVMTGLTLGGGGRFRNLRPGLPDVTGAVA